MEVEDQLNHDQDVRLISDLDEVIPENEDNKANSSAYQEGILEGPGFSSESNEKLLKVRQLLAADDSSDEDYEVDFGRNEIKKEFDHTGKDAYYDACRRYSTTPVSYFLRHMQSQEVILKYHGIGPVGAKAIAASLMANTRVLKLNLQENFIGPLGCKAICDMLKENCYITELIMSDNCIGPSGCRWVHDMLQSNINLVKLDLSRNQLGDRVGEYLCDALKNNYRVSWLSLGGNELGTKVGMAIGPAINANDAIEYLDLSWNQIRGQGAIDLANGLRANCTLKVIDFSWNGFGNVGAVALADALRANNTLTEMDISNNRIGVDGATAIAKGLQGNSTLEILKLDYNPITCQGAQMLLSTVYNKSDSAIKAMHFKGTLMNEELEVLLKDIKENRGIAIAADYKRYTPLQILKRFIQENKDRWLETFADIDTDGTSRVSQDDFMKVIVEFGIEFDLEEKSGLLSVLKKDKQGRIKYRDTSLGIPKEKKLPPEIAKSNHSTKSLGRNGSSYAASKSNLNSSLSISNKKSSRLVTKASSRLS